jgi:outer membrane lipoprotein-sorting protein
MGRKTKKFSLFLAFLLVLSVLSGCSSGSQETSGERQNR